MKLHLPSPHLPQWLHRPRHLGQRWHSLEGAGRVVQLVLMVLLALFCAKLIAGGAILALRALSGIVT